jgi:hypothetical protein
LEFEIWLLFVYEERVNFIYLFTKAKQNWIWFKNFWLY